MRQLTWLGQENFISNSSNRGGAPAANTLNEPYDGVYGLHGQLFIADSGNNRVLIWNTFPSSNGQAADVVIGQADFTLNKANDADGDGASDSSCSEETLSNPKGIYVEGNKLIIADGGNYRYLIYDGE